MSRLAWEKHLLDDAAAQRLPCAFHDCRPNLLPPVIVRLMSQSRPRCKGRGWGHLCAAATASLMIIDREAAALLARAGRLDIEVG